MTYSGKNAALYTTIAGASFAAGFWKEYAGAEGFGPSAMLVGIPAAGAVVGGALGPGFKSRGDMAAMGDFVDVGVHAALGAGIAIGSELAGMITAYVVKRF